VVQFSQLQGAWEELCLTMELECLLISRMSDQQFKRQKIKRLKVEEIEGTTISLG
jgi:hypothetical protein